MRPISHAHIARPEIRRRTWRCRVTIVVVTTLMGIRGTPSRRPATSRGRTRWPPQRHWTGDGIEPRLGQRKAARRARIPSASGVLHGPVRFRGGGAVWPTGIVEIVARKQAGRPDLKTRMTQDRARIAGGTRPTPPDRAGLKPRLVAGYGRARAASMAPANG